MKCFYHNDMDGRCAGSIVARYENNYDVKNFFEVDYIMDLSPMIDSIEDKERVYFVDYSFKENTKHILDILLSKGCDVVWIDHHTSSISLIGKYEYLKGIQGVRQDGISGAALTYMYVYGCEFKDVPRHIQLVSDYDCWNFEFEPETTYFKLGLETNDFDALDNVWIDLLLGYRNNYTVLADILYKGSIIKEYIDKDNIQYRDNYAYETTISGYDALVVNKKTNSWVFGEKINEYDIVCIWVFNGDKYSYSIYSNKEYVNCSEIAETFGGGGHKGASGFSSDELLFTGKLMKA